MQVTGCATTARGTGDGTTANAGGRGTAGAVAYGTTTKGAAAGPTGTGAAACARTAVGAVSTAGGTAAGLGHTSGPDGRPSPASASMGEARTGRASGASPETASTGALPAVLSPSRRRLENAEPEEGWGLGAGATAALPVLLGGQPGPVDSHIHIGEGLLGGGAGAG
jgi:hypothetical protein